MELTLSSAEKAITKGCRAAPDFSRRPRQTGPTGCTPPHQLLGRCAGPGSRAGPAPDHRTGHSMKAGRGRHQGAQAQIVESGMDAEARLHGAALGLPQGARPGRVDPSQAVFDQGRAEAASRHGDIGEASAVTVAAAVAPAERRQPALHETLAVGAGLLGAAAPTLGRVHVDQAHSVAPRERECVAVECTDRRRRRARRLGPADAQRHHDDEQTAEQPRPHESGRWPAR